MGRFLVLSILFLSGMLNSLVFGSSYGYPELMVSPKASERIRLEIDREKRGGLFKNHKGLQVAGLVTLVAGVFQLSNTDITKDANESSSKLGILVGGGWLVATSLLDMKYRPYQVGHQGLSRIKGKTKRDQLAKERLAEEAIDNAGRLGKRLDYLGAATNFLASAYMMSSAKKETISVGIGALSLLTSLTPLIFKNYWTEVSKKQNSYKKKVYGPIAFSPFLFDQVRKKYVTGASLAFTF